MKFLLPVLLVLTEAAAPAHDYSRPLTLKPKELRKVAGYLPHPGDRMFFVFRSAGRRRLSLSVQSLKGSLIPQAIVVFPSGDQEGPGTDLKINLREPGTYRVRVSAREQTSGRFELQLRID